MTRLSVVSALSILPDGSIDLGEQDVKRITIGDVKRMVRGRCGGCEDNDVLYLEPQLWWHGYLLDEDDENTIAKACVGVNPGEVLQGNEETLVLFLTTQEEKDEGDGEGHDLDSSFTRLRSNSFDIVRSEIRKSRETISKCIVM